MNEESRPLISLILAVYDTRAYLAECIDSVLSQSYKNWELLIVDDGSTDGSSAICDDYARRDHRISVTHKPNTGKADSCNKALVQARGEYIGFIDSDDWIDADYLEVLINSIMLTGKQCSSCGYVNEYADASEPAPVTDQASVLESGSCLVPFYNRQLYSFLHTRLFHRSLLQEPIPPLKRFEDQAVLYKWLSHGNGIALCPQCLYHYRQRRSSLMNSGSTPYGLVPILEECYRFVAQHRLLSEEENKRIVVTQLVREAKDAARAGGKHAEVVGQIRSFLQEVQPISNRTVSSKTLRRLRQLLNSPRYFVLTQRLCSLFVIGHHTPQHEYYP